MDEFEEDDRKITLKQLDMFIDELVDEAESEARWWQEGLGGFESYRYGYFPHEMQEAEAAEVGEQDDDLANAA